MIARVEEVRKPGKKVAFYAIGRELGKQSRMPDCAHARDMTGGDDPTLLLEIEGPQPLLRGAAAWPELIAWDRIQTDGQRSGCLKTGNG